MPTAKTEPALSFRCRLTELAFRSSWLTLLLGPAAVLADAPRRHADVFSVEETALSPTAKTC